MVRRVDELMGVCAKPSKLGSGEWLNLLAGQLGQSDYCRPTGDAVRRKSLDVKGYSGTEFSPMYMFNTEVLLNSFGILLSLNTCMEIDLKCIFSGWCKCCFLSFQHLVNLFARLANDNIGYIDWDPYIPKVHGFIVLFFGQCLGPCT